MIVVADTSPLNYLVLIGEIEIIPKLYGTVYLPVAVFDELQDRETPAKVKAWAAALPAWAEVRNVTPATFDAALMDLDQGEREAIFLALELGAKTVLMDDAKGRAEAESRQIEVRGTLGILERAANLGYLNFREALARLEKTSFRLNPRVRQDFLSRNP